MPGSRTLAPLALAALFVFGACGGDDDDDGFFTAPDPPPSGNPTSDAECVGDVRAPILTSLGASTRELWPPNHQMVRVTLHAEAEDPCTPVDFRIVSVRSNQPVNGLGDGDTAPDWEILGPMAVNLRAERSGKSGEREYIIRVRFADAAGNEGFENIGVWVPHDQR